MTAALALAPLLAPVTASAAPAQPAARGEASNVTLALRDAPLRTALQTLFQGSGLQHAVEPTVPNYPITLDIREVPFSTALRTMLRLAPGVTFRKEGDIYIIGMRQPQVEQPTVGQDIQPAGPDPGGGRSPIREVPLNFTNYQVMGYILGGVPIPTEDQVQRRWRWRWLRRWRRLWWWRRPGRWRRRLQRRRLWRRRPRWRRPGRRRLWRWRLGGFGGGGLGGGGFGGGGLGGGGSAAAASAAAALAAAAWAAAASAAAALAAAAVATLGPRARRF